MTQFSFTGELYTFKALFIDVVYLYLSNLCDWICAYSNVQYCCYKIWEPITFGIIDVKLAVAQFAVLYLNIITTWVDDRNFLYK